MLQSAKIRPYWQGTLLAPRHPPKSQARGGRVGAPYTLLWSFGSHLALYLRWVLIWLTRVVSIAQRTASTMLTNSNPISARRGYGQSSPNHCRRTPGCLLYPENGHLRKPSPCPLSAMCGRLQVGKSFLHVSRLGRCSHVSGL
jgi:hypothetical protein